ncbi:MAG: DUF4139 domain-containing protein [Candidatus Eisenbacteria bacterium]|nr:DUF4139 domain-containing protein [Candidatus Eisenbacteria bacterium]
MRLSTGVAALAACCFFLCAGSLVMGEVAVTVYNENIALVKELRKMSFPRGESQVEFRDVAARIDPTSVHFVSKTNPKSVSILEQNYEYDLVSAAKILQKYVDNRITVFTKDEKVFEGTLLSFDAQNLVLGPEEKQGPVTVVSRENVRDVSFPALPGGLITKPTLVWKILSESAGANEVEVSYLTDGLNWHAEYVAVSDLKDENLGVAGWVSVENNSGATYENAKLKLVAGNIHRVVTQLPRTLYKTDELGSQMAAPVTERAFFEYHLYSVEKPTTVKDNEIKQISLFPETKTAVKKVFTYDGANYPDQVRITLEFVNSEAAGLGIPLPKGKVRVYKEDVDKALEFVGEDAIEHTPKGEKVRVYVGNAFDVVGERATESVRQITRTLREETTRIKLRNHKEEAVDIIVVEHIWGQWSMIANSLPFVKKDANTIEFTAKVLAGQEVVLTYTARIGY